MNEFIFFFAIVLFSAAMLDMSFAQNNANSSTSTEVNEVPHHAPTYRRLWSPKDGPLILPIKNNAEPPVFISRSDQDTDQETTQPGEGAAP